MEFRLSAGTFAAASGDDLVLLDLRDGAYASLPGCASQVVLDGESSAAFISDPDLASALSAAGAIEPGLRQARPSAPAPARCVDLLSAGDVRPKDLAGLCRALAWMGRCYWRAPFGKLVERAQGSALGDCGDLAAVEQATLTFRTMLPWIPFQGVCLYRSCLLLAFLRQSGLSASWIFGVQTFPFEAHCWLQADDLVLDDDIEHVSSLAPILALAP
jgi:Transglutaminase-like superfamily